MTRKSIQTNGPVISCDVCGRTLLRGEHADVFLHGGSRRMVCELCTARAVHEGWIREGLDDATVRSRQDGRRRRSLLQRLKGLRPEPRRQPEPPPTPQRQVVRRRATPVHHDDPQWDEPGWDEQPYGGEPQGREQEPYGGGHDQDPYAGGHQEEPYGGGHEQDRYAGGHQEEPYGGGHEQDPYAGDREQEPYAGGHGQRPGARDGHRYAGDEPHVRPQLELEPRHEPGPSRRAHAAPPREQHQHHHREHHPAREQHPPREQRSVHAVPTNADLKMARALDLFNASSHRRTVSGVARSLGAPSVSVRPSPTEGSVVVIVVAWELSWYRYEVDLADEAAGVRVAAQGAELDELEPEEREPNAEADDGGSLRLAGRHA